VDAVVSSTIETYEVEKLQLLKERQALLKSLEAAEAKFDKAAQDYAQELTQLETLHKAERSDLASIIAGETSLIKDIHAKRWEEVKQQLLDKEAESVRLETLVRQLKEELKGVKDTLQDKHAEYQRVEGQLHTHLEVLPKYQQDTSELRQLRKQLQRSLAAETFATSVLSHLTEVLGEHPKQTVKTEQPWQQWSSLVRASLQQQSY
jgi:chromosome segregation ATPase